jgi:hypothetical protein
LRAINAPLKGKLSVESVDVAWEVPARENWYR